MGSAGSQIILVAKEHSLRKAVIAICLCALLSFLVIGALAQQPTGNQTISTFGACERQSGQSRRFRITDHRGVERQSRAFCGNEALGGERCCRSRPDREGFRSDRCSHPLTPSDDLRFRSAATRLLQNYGYLLPKANPDSEIGREQAALEQERIRELVATQQAQAQQTQQNQLAKCDGSASLGDASCQGKPKPAQNTAVQTGTSNPGELPRDRDFGQLLTNPVPQTDQRQWCAFKDQR